MGAAMELSLKLENRDNVIKANLAAQTRRQW